MIRKGFTLLEALISIFLLTTIISLVAFYQLESFHLLHETKVKRLIETQISSGLDEISREIQKASKIVALEQNKLTFQSQKYEIKNTSLSKKDTKVISYYIGVFNQNFSKDYELPRYGLIRNENEIIQPVVYYFGDSPSSMKVSYFDDSGNMLDDESEIDKVKKIKIEISTTTFRFQQKVHKEITVNLI